MLWGKIWKKLFVFVLFIFITLLLPLKIRAYSPQLDGYFININTLSGTNIHLHHLLLEYGKERINEENYAQIAAAVECGSIPTSGCWVTKDTTFIKGTYYLTLGIYLDANNIVLDCNGATLVGTGAMEGGSGINSYEGRYPQYSTIKNCIIKSYTTGIWVKGSHNTINSNEISNTIIGIYIVPDSEYNMISNNDISSARTDGIVVAADNNQINSNNLHNNDGTGVGLFGSNNQLNSNTVCSSKYFDFYMDPDVTNTGDNNKCDKTYNWNDFGTSGCTYSCSGGECGGTDTSCGIYPNCENCNSNDGCSGNYYRNYYCISNAAGCSYTSDNCNDCSCSCGGYNTPETTANGNCNDGKDNDCDGKTDSADSGCQQDECTSGPCCDLSTNQFKPYGAQPTGYIDDTDGFCYGSNSPTETSYVRTRDYYCNGNDANMHYSDTTFDTCGTCEYCTNNDLTCNYYTSSTTCGTKDCDYLDTTCRNYHDVDRYCAGTSGTCNDATCNSYTNTPAGTSCGTNKECDGNGNCVEIDSCTNGARDEDETGIDCGGSCLNQDCCINGYRDDNLNEEGVDCGGRCKPCVGCDNRMQDGDEEGVDCGGSCPEDCYRLKILAIPVEWTGSQAHFNDDVERLINFFINDVPLSGCPEKVLVNNVDIKQYNFKNWICWLHIPPDLYLFAERKGLKPDQYDFVIGFSNHKLCNWYGVSNGKQTGLVSTHLPDNSIVAHEIGHFYDLEDEYCSNPAGSWHPYCNDGDMGAWWDGGNDGALTGDKNWLDTNLECNPVNPNEGGNCCEVNGLPNCEDVDYDVCCRGNTNSKGGIATMSYTGAQWDFPGDRGFDDHSKEHLNQFNNLHCSDAKMLISSSLNSYQIIDNKMLDINLVIYQNNSVKENWINLLDGTPEQDFDNYGNVNLTITDIDNNVIWYHLFDFTFDYNGPMLRNETYSDINYSYRDIGVRAPYNHQMKKIKLYLNNQEIFSVDLNFCNNNSICDGDETYLSCWQDCPAWSEDGLCIAEEDTGCDPDCSEGIDPDCLFITVISPVDNAIYNTPSVDLKWTVNKKVDWCGYSLDGNANDTSINPNYWCYQETANKSTYCGGLHNGAYGEAPGGYFYVNYSKPLGSEIDTLWEVKTSAGSSTYSIPSSCFKQQPLQFRIQSQNGFSNYVNGKCYNNSDWISIFSASRSEYKGCGMYICEDDGIISAMDGDWNTYIRLSEDCNTFIENYDVACFDTGKIYEEAMWWYIVSRNITLTNLSEGTHNITIYCNDTGGNMGQSDYVYFTIEIPETININLNQGWNLISIPLKLPNNSINHIFNNTNLTIYGYKNNSFFVPKEIDNKLGYWLKINETKNIPLVGTEIENKIIELNQGWNLIGYPYLEEKNMSEIFDNYTIYSYKLTWLSYIPERSFNSLKKLKPGYGYWVKTE